MTGSVHLPCVECGDPASQTFEGKAYCDDCHDDLMRMDFYSSRRE